MAIGRLGVGDSATISERTVPVTDDPSGLCAVTSGIRMRPQPSSTSCCQPYQMSV